MSGPEFDPNTMLHWYEEHARRQAFAHGHNVGKLLSKLNEAHRDARRDSLTGALNRRGVLERGEEQLRLNPEVALLFIDLDKFKQVNDTKGHQAGDELLQTATQIIMANIRKQDILGRPGGDEFVVVADMRALEEVPDPNLSETEKSGLVHDRANLIIERIQTAYTEATGETMSIGYVLYDPNEHTAGLSDMMAEADGAMYLRKNGQAAA